MRPTVVMAGFSILFDSSIVEIVVVVVVVVVVIVVVVPLDLAGLFVASLSSTGLYLLERRRKQQQKQQNRSPFTEMESLHRPENYVFAKHTDSDLLPGRRD